ncbi:MAG: twin-arginine translocase subunit TatC [Methanocellales archaeon]|nr:twin-arginine translocase subunit TatC [Methanocellales archaeon]
MITSYFAGKMSAAKRYDAPPGDKELPLVEHVGELRHRLLIIMGVVAVITVVVIPFSDGLLRIIWNDLIPPNVDMVFYGPWEIIKVRITLSLICALIVGIPLLMYEMVAFMNPGLYPSERRFLLIVIPFSLILFVAGAFLGYFVLLPLLLKLLIFHSGSVAIAQLSVGKTFSMVTMMLAGLGIVFQFPLLVVLAVKMGAVKYETLKGKRWWVYAALLAFAVFISPDPTAISQLVVAIVLVALFEVSLLIARFL